MAVDFHQLIDRNKRNSWLLMGLFTLFVVGLGAIMGYAIGLQTGDPDAALFFAVLMMGAAAVFAVISTTASYFGGTSAVLRMSGARLIEKKDDPQLYNVVEEMAIAAGVPPPKVYVIDQAAPNAFAAGRDPQHAVVAITQGLRQKLNRDELQGVIAHEMAHIRNYDIRFAILMATLVGVVVIMSDMFLRSMGWGYYRRSSRGFGGSRRSTSSGKGGGAVVIVLVLLAILLSILAPLLAKIIEMAFSRQREYLADASAVELTRNPEGLAGALSKIHADPEVLEVVNRATAPMYIVHPMKHLKKGASSRFDSHPPIEDRIRRLQSLVTPGGVPQKST